MEFYELRTRMLWSFRGSEIGFSWGSGIRVWIVSNYYHYYLDGLILINLNLERSKPDSSTSGASLNQ